MCIVSRSRTAMIAIACVIATGLYNAWRGIGRSVSVLRRARGVTRSSRSTAGARCQACNAPAPRSTRARSSILCGSKQFRWWGVRDGFRAVAQRAGNVDDGPKATYRQRFDSGFLFVADPMAHDRRAEQRERAADDLAVQFHIGRMHVDAGRTGSAPLAASRTRTSRRGTIPLHKAAIVITF